MGSGKFSSEINKLFTNKKFTNAVCVVIGLAFVLIGITFFTDKGSKGQQTIDDKGTVESNKDGESIKETIDEYQTRKQDELKNFLSQMDGVGNVEVIINFESGEVKVPAVDKNTQISTTEENDKEGGTRTNKQQTGGSKVVMAGDNGNEALILQTNKPRVVGIMITAEGADSEKVKYEIQKAVASLYDVSLEKVNVYRMKQ